MNRKEFEQMLEKSLAQLENGEGLSTILKENPQDAAELEPLLQAALTAWALPKPDYEDSQRRGRNRLLAEADRLLAKGTFAKNRTKSKFSRYTGQWFKNIGDLLVGKENGDMKLLPRLALYAVMTVLIAGFFTVNASASSLPGDSLYRLKLGWEQAQLALTFNDDARLELEDEFEDQRLNEVGALLGEGRVEDVEFRGLIESKSEGSWVVSGISVAVDSRTEVKGALEVGDLVKVEALTQADGSLLALEIYAEGADLDRDLNADADDDLNDDADDDLDDDSADDLSDDANDDLDDDSADDLSDDADDGADVDLDDSSDDDESDDADDGQDSSDDDSDSSDDDSSDDSSDEPEEADEPEEDEVKSDD